MCVCVREGVYGVSGCLGRPDLAIRSPGAGVIGCELPDVGAERLWQIKRHSQRQSHSPAPSRQL